MSQTSAILSHLKAGRCIDPMMALQKFGSFRLGARIFELRQAGYRISCKLIKTRTNKRIGVYKLV